MSFFHYSMKNKIPVNKINKYFHSDKKHSSISIQNIFNTYFDRGTYQKDNLTVTYTNNYLHIVKIHSYILCNLYLCIHHNFQMLTNKANIIYQGEKIFLSNQCKHSYRISRNFKHRKFNIWQSYHRHKFLEDNLKNQHKLNQLLNRNQVSKQNKYYFHINHNLKHCNLSIWLN